MKHWWNDTNRGKLKYLKKNLCWFHCVHCSPAYLALGPNSSFCSEMPVIDHLSHGTVRPWKIMNHRTYLCGVPKFDLMGSNHSSRNPTLCPSDRTTGSETKAHHSYYIYFYLYTFCLLYFTDKSWKTILFLQNGSIWQNIFGNQDTENIPSMFIVLEHLSLLH